MRFLMRILGAAVLLAVLAGGALVADILFNGRRLTDMALGRAGLEAACRPALLARLAAAGFEPANLAFAQAPDMSWSSATGRTLSGPFTFEDGASAARVDGVMACTVRDGAVGLEMRTATTPLRAT